MAETAENLTTAYTRKELEEMARKQGIYPTREKYPSKTDLADAIIKGNRSKGAARKPEVAKKPMYKAEVMTRVKSGGKGVYGIKKSFDVQASENRNAVKRIGASIDACRGGIEQERSKMRTSVKKLDSDIAKERSSMNAYSANMLTNIGNFENAMFDKVRGIFDNVRVMQNCIEDQVKENKHAVANIETGVNGIKVDIGRERSMMKDNAKKFRRDVDDFRVDMDEKTADINAGVRDLDRAIDAARSITAGYVKDFYFG